MKLLSVAFVIVCVLASPCRIVAQVTEKPNNEKPPVAAPQTDLMRLISELLDEVKQLRREVNQLRAEVSANLRDEKGERRRRIQDEAYIGRRADDEDDEHQLEKRRDREAEKKRRKVVPEAIPLKSVGVIKDMNPAGKSQRLTLTVIEDGKEMTLDLVLGEATVITLDGKVAKFEELKPGDHVECEYILKGEKLAAVARSIVARRGTTLQGGKQGIGDEPQK